MEAIGEGKIGARVESEGATKPPLASQRDFRQLEQRQDIFADQRPWVFVEALKRKDRLEDDRHGRLDPKATMLYAVEIQGGAGRVVGVVL